MRPRDDRQSLRQMFAAAREAANFARQRPREQFDADRLFFLAMLQLLQIMGEAASRVPEEVQREHPEIPWVPIVALRNRLIHGYHTVDRDILWQILTGDLPDLLAALEKLKELSEPA